MSETFRYYTGTRERIIISACGSRGDVQPFVALAGGLQEAGYNVRVATNVNHVPFCEAMGVYGVPVFLNLDQAHSEPAMKARLNSHFMRKYAGEISRKTKEAWPIALKKKLALIKEFVPDILITSPQCNYEDVVIGATLHIPVLQAYLQAPFPSGNKISNLGEPAGIPHRWHLACATLLLHMFWSNQKSIKDPELLNQVPGCESNLMPSRLRVLMRYLMHPPAQMLVGSSTLLNPEGQKRSPDWHDDLQPKFCGPWVIPDSKQYGGNFGMAQSDQLQAFIEGGEAPVYIGWGAMNPTMGNAAEYMTCIAVRALMKAGCRGVIVSGFVSLSFDKLKGQADTDSMEVYAKKHILFMKSAPHEWLFPRCLCTLHHGGAGTTLAALRAGVPTIITPYALDQYDYAQVVKDTNTGIALGKFTKLTLEQIVQAIVECKTNACIQGNAAAMGEGLRSEDGVAVAVEAVEKFVKEDIKLNKYRTRMDDWKKDRAILERRSSMGCFGWCHRICWAVEPNNYLPTIRYYDA